ncbi:hypothetical protein Tco_0056960, partial [Tanacetum coccineum]
IEEAVASGKLAHLVRDICLSNQKSRNQRRNDMKVINMITWERNHKRPYEEERSSLTEELTFPTIPRNTLMDEPIVLEGMIEGIRHNENKQGSPMGVQSVGKNVGLVGRNTMASSHGTNVKNMRTSTTANKEQAWAETW